MTARGRARRRGQGWIGFGLVAGLTLGCGSEVPVPEASKDGAANPRESTPRSDASPAPRGPEARPSPTGHGAAPAKGKGYPDPLLVKVCMAFEAEVGHDPGEEMLLARTAARAVDKHGVSEAQLAKIGANPTQVLAYVKSHGSPTACTGFVAALEKAAARNETVR